MTEWAWVDFVPSLLSSLLILWALWLTRRGAYARGRRDGLREALRLARVTEGAALARRRDALAEGDAAAADRALHVSSGAWSVWEEIWLALHPERRA